MVFQFTYGDAVEADTFKSLETLAQLVAGFGPVARRADRAAGSPYSKMAAWLLAADPLTQDSASPGSVLEALGSSPLPREVRRIAVNSAELQQEFSAAVRFGDVAFGSQILRRRIPWALPNFAVLYKVVELSSDKIGAVELLTSAALGQTTPLSLALLTLLNEKIGMLSAGQLRKAFELSGDRGVASVVELLRSHTRAVNSLAFEPRHGGGGGSSWDAEASLAEAAAFTSEHAGYVQLLALSPEDSPSYAQVYEIALGENKCQKFVEALSRGAEGKHPKTTDKVDRLLFQAGSAFAPYVNGELGKNPDGSLDSRAQHQPHNITASQVVKLARGEFLKFDWESFCMDHYVSRTAGAVRTASFFSLPDTLVRMSKFFELLLIVGHSKELVGDLEDLVTDVIQAAAASKQRSQFLRNVVTQYLTAAEVQQRLFMSEGGRPGAQAPKRLPLNSPVFSLVKAFLADASRKVAESRLTALGAVGLNAPPASPTSSVTLSSSPASSPEIVTGTDGSTRKKRKKKAKTRTPKSPSATVAAKVPAASSPAPTGSPVLGVAGTRATEVQISTRTVRGSFIRVENVVYNVSAAVADIKVNNPSFLVRGLFAKRHLAALLHCPTGSKAVKKSWLPADAPTSCLDLPFPGFDANKYKHTTGKDLAGKDLDFA